MADAVTWPVKTRDIHSHYFKSTMWDDFAFRNDDSVIATFAKSGTTWMQQIVSQLIFAGPEGLDLDALSPWLDNQETTAAEVAALDAQTHRRFI